VTFGTGGAQAQPTIDARRIDEIVDQLTAIVGQLRTLNDGCSTGVCPTGLRIRDAMVLFMRTNGKFPDVIEVGPAVFLEMHDWHVRNRQALNVGRGADGRYGLGYLFTRLILRTDAQPDFLGVPYDLRA
jgi:hypothetical protein